MLPLAKEKRKKAKIKILFSEKSSDHWTFPYKSINISANLALYIKFLRLLGYSEHSKHFCMVKVHISHRESIGIS